MRKDTTRHPSTGRARGAILALLAAVLLLGGCSATHVGDAWQCPVAQGTACASVAEADPAVTSSGKDHGPRIPGPPEYVGDQETGGLGSGCDEECSPLAWLANWFNISDAVGARTASVEPDTASPGEETLDEADDGLRTKERIARIWIASFVDSDGVYREAHWVRTVLEPARWRLR